MRMPCCPTRVLPAAFTVLLLSACLTSPALAQAGRRPIQPIPPRPAVTTPGTPAIVTPGKPAVTSPGRPAIVTPGRPAVVSPGQPAITYPVTPTTTTRPITSTPLKPSTPITTYPISPTKPVPLPTSIPSPGPGHGHDHDHGHGHGHGHHHHHPHIIVIPSYPAAYIGPEIISVTTYPTDVDNGAAAIPAPVPGGGAVAGADAAVLQGDAATPRLIAILGRLERIDGSLPSGTGTAAGGEGDRLCVGVATLTAYYNPDPDQPTEAMARGTYFGSRWDGDAWHTSATGLWSRGPVTRQPILTLHELRPSTFPFEVARPGHRITSLRLAIALMADRQSSPAAATTSREGATTKATPRHLAMANGLRRRLQETDEPVPLAPPLNPQAPAPIAEPDPRATYLGKAHSPFGQVLGDSLQELIGTPTPAFLGSAEWTLPLSDLRDIMSGCPRFTTIPLPADLQTVRARDTSPAPLWVRPFRMEAGDGAVVYQGEVWFLIVPDGALRGW